MITVTDLSFSYPYREPLFNDISFIVEAGKSMLISGVSGIGKSTLLNCLCGVIPRNIKGELTGTVYIDDKNVTEMSPAELPAYVSMVFQSPFMFFQDVESELAFVLENLCFDFDEIDKRITGTLELTELTELRYINPSKLSGGQVKMVALAAAVVLPPRVLLLDEICAGLDDNALNIVRKCISLLKENGSVIIASEHMTRVMEFDKVLSL